MKHGASHIMRQFPAVKEKMWGQSGAYIIYMGKVCGISGMMIGLQIPESDSKNLSWPATIEGSRGRGWLPAGARREAALLFRGWVSFLRLGFPCDGIYL